jgi:protein-S-isoprenylcysteine O-methyltransferase Ste14
MSELKEINELNHALISNFRLKAKSLAIMFGVVFCFQISILGYFSTQTDLVGKTIPLRVAIVGPLILLCAILSEILAIRYLKKIQNKEIELKQTFIYLVTFIEVSFPMGVMLMIGDSLRSNPLVHPLHMVNSPLFVVVFIMITLSSLLLDFSLCVFAGIVGGIEYLLVNINFLANVQTTKMDYANAAGKSIFVIVTGLLAGFVSKKIREAIVSSLHSKNELIHHLDLRVAEKTAEIQNKNILLEEKQKEILDSIHYARRIQTTLLPSEKYIEKSLGRLTKSE